jgi:hypothetical protein
MNTVWIYVDIAREVGDPEHLKVFATERPRRAGSEQDPEGVAFEYDVIEA